MNTVEQFLAGAPDTTLSTIVFNVFKDEDLILYKKLLGYDEL